MINSYFFFEIPINGQIAQNPDDLNNFSKQELWDVLVSFMVNNIQLKSELDCLTGSVNQKEPKIVTLRGELSDLAEVKTQLISVVRENKIFEDKLNSVFEDKLNSVVRELISVKQEFRQINEALCARKIGYKTDELVRKFIFSDSVKKPYYIRSLKNLLKFISDPNYAEKYGLCGERARDEWFKLSESKREDIIQKSRIISEEFPDLQESIESLKSNWCTAHPKCESYDAILDFFREAGDDDTASSLLECRPFYDYSVFDRIAVDSNSKTEFDSSL